MIQLAGLAIGAALTVGTMVPAAVADQAAADAAIDAFSQRMVEAGFVAGPDDDEPDDTVTDDDDDASDDPFDDCLGDAGIEVPDDPDAPFPGTIAEAESPEFEFAVDDEPESTEMFDLTPAIPESIAAMISTVDDSSVEQMAQLIDWMGSKAAADCYEQSLLGEMLSTEPDDGEADDGDDDFEMPPPEIELSNSGDVGVGDRSARIDMSFSMTFMVQIEMDITMLFAQSGRSMVMLMHATGADGATSGVDPVAELQALVDDLAA